ncbi:cAMP phosphodiesterases class-II-domain-containing protein [Aspergillus spectabilis]
MPPSKKNRSGKQSPVKAETPEDDGPPTQTGPTDGDKQSIISEEDRAIQVVVLGPTGGPREDRVTSLLVKSLATEWTPNSMVAVDAGTMLCGIINVLRQSKDEEGSKNTEGSKKKADYKNEDGIVKSGPFAGLRLPHARDTANAAYIFRQIIGSVLITHSHLDHISGLAINTPVLEAGHAPKTIAALPPVVDALKTHVFNSVIWPNLSDEDGGVGTITYQRLVDGGNALLGRGQEKGYVQACEGLLVMGFGISHGHGPPLKETDAEILRRASSVFLSGPVDRSATGTPSAPRSPYPSREISYGTVESSAFFLRDQHTGAEILVFGDVEPDTISQNPRNKKVWEIAAPKVVSRQLRAIFIECSYSDATEDVSLFGHLCPRHLVDELTVLGQIVAQAKGLISPIMPSTTKRKREPSSDPISETPLSPKTKRASASDKSKGKERGNTEPQHTRFLERTSEARETSESPFKVVPTLSHNKGTSSSKDMSDGASEISSQKPIITVRRRPSAHHVSTSFRAINEKPLLGLSIFVIHVKEDMSDSPHPREKILEELKKLEELVGLGCEFHFPRRGESIFL